MKITFNPDVKSTGLQSFASWDNPQVHDALLKLFQPRRHEKLVEVSVTPEGLHGHFELESLRGHFESIKPGQES